MVAFVPVVAPFVVMTKDPAAGKTLATSVAAPSGVRMMAMTVEVADTRLFVTVMAEAPAAMRTRPRGLLFVTLPGVPVLSVNTAPRFDVRTLLGVVAPIGVLFMLPPLIAAPATLPPVMATALGS